MISAGVEGRLPYMTYSEPWSRNPPKQPAEVFLRPHPKLLPPATRTYNGVPSVPTSYPNGGRIGKYPSPPPSSLPVNLTHQKEDVKEEPLSPYSPYRPFPPSPQYSLFPYPSICPQPYMLRTPTFPPTPLSPQEMFSPATPTASSTATFLPPHPETFNPPTSLVKSTGGVLKRNSPVPNSPLPQSPSFKVPSGKEGSMKHRLLIRPEDSPRPMPLDLQKPPEGRRRLVASTASPPRSPRKHLNNNTVPANFQKGQLVQLGNGELKRIEDMRTEDFVQSAEKNPALRLAESTVVKIEEGKEGHVTITLTYDQRRAQVEVDSTPDHPYFVMGHGWASCSPDKTLQCHGLKVHRLQVGDVMVSLAPRELASATSSSSRGTTIMTTATTTAMSARQYSGNYSNTMVTNSTSTNPFMLPSPKNHHHRPLSHSPPKSVRSPDYGQPMGGYYAPPSAQLTPLPLDAESRKRRWSAPDAIEEEEELAKRSRVE
ncbi:uncharacterized protein Atx-1 [Euwallacea fornicatus]|uniref:uncharacterized protein Atx-1 n=1 Tax=Euwallacea fornicatus TaxID=995702 RepID=UPI00338D44F5